MVINMSYACVLSHFSCVKPFPIPRTVACQSLLSMGFCRQEYWSGLPCSPPWDLSHPETESHISYIPCISKQVLYSATWEAQICSVFISNIKCSNMK